MIFLGIFLGASLTVLVFQILTLVYISKNPKYKKAEIERKIEQKKVENEILSDIVDLQDTLDELTTKYCSLQDTVKEKEYMLKKMREE